ncbi:hypothetical protein ACH4A7_28490 [Streptomyces cyaneofuscatus]|uniref:hypothetical protein n=1 Tax=Streptomyces cyaneofuscatus TaxID=66883 RepID=UPI0037AD1B8E
MSRLGAPGRASATQLASLSLLGDLGRPATLTVRDLRDGWRQHRAEVGRPGPVDQALKEIAVTHGGMDADEASAYVRRLASDRRYVRDVY